MQNFYTTKYYYFNPFSKQCYFPEGFDKYPLFATFYRPYKISAKLLWEAWKTSTLFRSFCSTNEPEKILPLKQIGKYVSPDSIMAFNLGTTGIEQKITILGVDRTTNDTFFIKYATSEVACKNVCNEGVILKQLSHLPFVPELQSCVKEENRFALIKTSVLHGTKMEYLPVNNEILTILRDLSKQDITCTRKYDTGLRSCFAHGDFCPWNMLTDNGNITLCDWELAGQYPLGYDLFTYIFQFEFLVREKMRFERILYENSDAIKQYFNEFEITDWHPYLQEFSNLKYLFESEKNNHDLVEPYLQLKQFANKL